MPDEGIEHSEVEQQADGAVPAGGEPSAVATAARKPLSLTKRVAFSIVTLLLAWMALEVGGFFMYWLVTGHRFSWAEMQHRRKTRAMQPLGPGTSFTTIHPFVGYVDEPGQESGVFSLADEAPVPVSSFGYLDDKDPIQVREPGRVIIGITGGSVASFFAINGTRQLEAELSRDPAYKGKRFVFVNVALRGYKQPQQLMTLSYLLSLGAQFDMILNIDGFNEVALYELENASSHIFPAFPRGWKNRVGHSDPIAGHSRLELMSLAARRRSLALWHSSALLRYSVLANILWDVLDDRLEQERFKLTEKAYRSQPGRGPYLLTGPPREFASDDELYDHLAAIWANSSTVMDEICRGQGIRYYHFLQPNQYVDGSKPMSAAERKIAIFPGHPYQRGVALGYPRLRRAGEDLRRLGIAFHDLSGIFAEDSQPIYIDSCCHLNLVGYEIMARAIAETILGEENHPASSVQGMEAGTGTNHQQQ